jgi:predicted secreted acid phosphatase
MLKKINSLILILSILTFASCSKNSKILNIYTAKDEVTKYHKSGGYLNDVKMQVDKALSYIKKKVENKKDNEKLAIVFDIDDTMLNQFDYEIANDYSQVMKMKLEYQKKGMIPANKPVLDLYNFAKKNDVAIFIISGRYDDMEDITLINLKKQGYNDYKKVYFNSPNNPNKTAKDYKTAIRKEIQNMGYTIIVNIGDQMSDLDGGFSETTYKLPNHIYFVD